MNKMKQVAWNERRRLLREKHESWDPAASIFFERGGSSHARGKRPPV